MPKIVGVRFKKASQIYYFDPADMQFQHGEDVIVETARGLALGKVAVTPTEAAAEELSEPLKSVVRRAQADDFEQLKEMKEKESNALAKCEELVAKFQLAMSPLAAEYNLDGTHLTVFFKAEKRVDQKRGLTSGRFCASFPTP
jgi:cell fate regulator YaaT (PSP1 superfamily)